MEGLVFGVSGGELLRRPRQTSQGAAEAREAPSTAHRRTGVDRLHAVRVLPAAREDETLAGAGSERLRRRAAGLGRREELDLPSLVCVRTRGSIVRVAE